MGSWSVSEESIAALNAMSDRLEEISTQINTHTQNMKSVFEANRSGLGAHAADIEKLIEEVENMQEEASFPVKKLVLKLRKAALIRLKHIQTKRYTPGGRSR